MIVGWWCRACKKQVPFGHFASCADSPHPPAWAAELECRLQKEESRESCAGGILSVSSLQDCPRRTFVKRYWRSEPRYADPDEMFDTTMGHLPHEAMARSAVKANLGFPEQKMGIIEIPGLSDVTGPVRLVPDLRYHDRSRLDDYKFPNTVGLYYVPKTGPSQEHNVQWNIYALASEQESGVRVDEKKSRIWYASRPNRKQAAEFGGYWLKRRPKRLTIDEILESRPHEGKRTIREIATTLRSAFRRVDDAKERPADVLSSIPPAGLTMMLDRKTGESHICKGCAALDICKAAGGWDDDANRKGDVDDLASLLGDLE